MPARLPEHLALIAGAPDGIRKLRGLILELAVRGKLVPQDPNDEPASELLKRIARERARLEAEGLCKKSKPVPVIGEDEHPFTQSKGWHWVRNGSLFSLRKGKVPKNLSEVKSDIPYLDIEALDRGNVRRYTTDVSTSQAKESDILVVCDGSRSGLVLNGKNGAIGSTLAVIESPRFIQPFIKIIFRQSFERLNSTMKGAAIPHLDTAQLILNVVGLPPLAEQHRIVAKVDELMALCDRLEAEQADADSAHVRLVDTLLGTLIQSTDAADPDANWQRLAEHFATLFTSESSLDALKQTILQLAVMGKLVPQDPNDEPASELLKRIAMRRSESLAKGYPNPGEAGTQTKKHEKQNCPKNLVQLPDGWSWATLMQCAELVVDCHNKTAPYSSTGVPLLRTTNIRDGSLNSKEPKFVSPDVYERWSARCKPEPGDLLITREAPMGEVCIIPDGMTVCMGQRIMLIRLVQDTVAPKFLLYSLLEPNLIERVQDKPVGATVEHLRVGGVETLLVQLPPLAEQHRIVAKVDELMALCDHLKADLAESRARQERLAATLIESALQAA